MRYFIWKLKLVSDILRVIVASTPFSKATIFVVCTEFPVPLKFDFSRFIFIDKYFKSKEIEYFIHDIKFEMWLVLLYVHSYFLSTVELKLEHGIFQFFLRFKMEIFECGFLGLLQFFPNSKEENRSFAFVNVAVVGLPNFFQFMK